MKKIKLFSILCLGILFLTACSKHSIQNLNDTTQVEQIHDGSDLLPVPLIEGKVISESENIINQDFTFSDETLTTKNAQVSFIKAEKSISGDGKPMAYLTFKITNYREEIKDAGIFPIEFIKATQEFNGTTKQLELCTTQKTAYSKYIYQTNSYILMPNIATELIYPVEIVDQNKPISIQFKTNYASESVASVKVDFDDKVKETEPAIVTKILNEKIILGTINTLNNSQNSDYYQYNNRTIITQNEEITLIKAEKSTDYLDHPLVYLTFKVTNKSNKAQHLSALNNMLMDKYQNIDGHRTLLNPAHVRDDSIYTKQCDLLTHELNPNTTTELVVPLEIINEHQPIFIDYYYRNTSKGIAKIVATLEINFRS